MTVDPDNEAEALVELVASQLRKPEGDIGKQVGRKMNEGNLLINRFAIDALNLKPGANVLEIGMGNGFFASDILALAPAVTYIGCDYSGLMVNEARTLNRDNIDKGVVQFVHADVEKLPFAAESFEAVLSVNTVYFWDLERALASILRVLKPNGQLTLALRPKRVMQTYAMAKHGFQLFTADNLSERLTQSGFDVTSTKEYEEPSQEILGTVCDVATLVLTATPA